MKNVPKYVTKKCRYYDNVSKQLICRYYVSHEHFLLKPYSRNKPLKFHINRQHFDRVFFAIYRQQCQKLSLLPYNTLPFQNVIAAPLKNIIVLFFIILYPVSGKKWLKFCFNANTNYNDFIQINRERERQREGEIKRHCSLIIQVLKVLFIKNVNKL